MPVDLRMSQDARCSHAGVEERRWGSSETGGKKDGGVGGVSFFIFYIIYSLLRYKKSHRALAMAKTKPIIQNVQTKETSGTTDSSTGVCTGLRPTYGHEIQTSKFKETLPIPVDSMKNNNHKPSFPETT